MTGGSWALLPSAAGVIDPLLSTGFPLTLLGIQRLLKVLEGPEWDGAVFEDSLAEYRLTGTETSPKEMLAELIGLGGIVPHISRKAGARKESKRVC